MPDFYVPWPARLNPNLDAARAHSKAWARQMGMISSSDEAEGAAIWDEARFDAMDFALMCAYTHPDTPGPELDLVTAWYVWGFYYDDFFVAYKRSEDRAGVRRHVDRLRAFMPLDLGAAVPEPKTPLERGAADLWARTARSKSPEWRARFYETCWQPLEENVREVSQISDQRVANPIEYIELRRLAGGARWSAALMEHALFIEVPARTCDTRPMQVLRDSFADAIHLRNDIFSYQREIEEEGELSNCVLVLERFLNVGAQRAADLVNDLLTSRLQQFENTVITELSPMCEEQGLSPAERATLLLYVKGLQDWQSGCHEWHLRSGRYTRPSNPAPEWVLPSGPTGLGTMTIRMPLSPAALGLQRLKSFSYVPFTSVGPIDLPNLSIPFAVEVSPHLDDARARVKRWARRTGLLAALPGLPGALLWSEQSLESADPALCAALIHPEASEAELERTAEWIAWMACADDTFQARYGRSHDMAGAKAWCARLSALLPDGAALAAVPVDPLERGLSDLWSRTYEELSPSERGEVRGAALEMIESWLWRLANRIQNRIPDVADCIEMRRRTLGVRLTMSLSRIGRGGDLPPSVLDAGLMHELHASAGDCGALTNDIFSYRKEHELEGELNNFVLVIQRFLDCTSQEAVGVVADMMTARAQQFEHLCDHDLPIFMKEMELPDAVEEQIRARIKCLKRWMVGAVEWHKVAGRYREHVAPSRTGVGRIKLDLSAPASPPAPPPRFELPAFKPGTGLSPAVLEQLALRGAGALRAASPPARDDPQACLFLIHNSHPEVT